MAKLVNIQQMGVQDVYDIGVDEYHNFIADGVVVHNCMRIAKELAGFTGPEANKLRKIIGKKQIDAMATMKEKFIKGAQPRIDAGDITKEEVVHTFELIEKFAGYGFNKSVDKSTKVIMVGGKIKRIDKIKAGDCVWCYNGGDLVVTEVVALHDHGELIGIEITFDDNTKEVCSSNHKFLTSLGQKPLYEIIQQNLKVISYAGNVKTLHAEQPSNMWEKRIVSTAVIGFRHMYDLEVLHPEHNFLLANGAITSNSHAVAYSALSCAELWLKWTYPVQFLAALINNTKANKKKAGTSNLLVDYINYARRHSIPVLQPDINLSKATFSIEQMLNIRYAFSHVRNVAKSAPSIMAGQPYASMEDFYERCVMVPFDDPYVYEEDDEDEESTETPKEAEEDAIPVQVPGKKVKPRKPGKKVVESLIYAGAFDRFGGRNEMMAKYYALRAKKKEVAPELTDDQLMEKEIEMIGLILSKPPIVQKYASLITQCKYTTIRDRTGKKRCLVFGQVEHIKPHTSKAGNSMFIVTYSDGLDSMQFFVFEGGKMMFTEKYRTGVMAAMPLKKFDDSETWFFDTNNDNGGVIEVP